MKVASFEPFITRILLSLGAGDLLCGVSTSCQLPEELSHIERICGDVGGSEEVEYSKFPVNFDLLRMCEADYVALALPWDKAPLNEQEKLGVQNALSDELSAVCGRRIRVKVCNPWNLDTVYLMYEELGVDLGRAARGRELASRMKAQFLDWSDNFYDRIKPKKVLVLMGLSPFRSAGLWLSSMIELAGGVPDERAKLSHGRVLNPADLKEMNPDVVVVAPEGFSLKDSMRTFLELEKLPGWDTLNAVKRGEVFFADGDTHFYYPGPELVDSMAILVSAMAGMESGYITKRDSFYRLRWLELQRHRI